MKKFWPAACGLLATFGVACTALGLRVRPEAPPPLEQREPGSGRWRRFTRSISRPNS